MANPKGAMMASRVTRIEALVIAMPLRSVRRYSVEAFASMFSCSERSIGVPHSGHTPVGSSPARS
jgi:hypothetical protein